MFLANCNCVICLLLLLMPIKGCLENQQLNVKVGIEGIFIGHVYRPEREYCRSVSKNPFIEGKHTLHISKLTHLYFLIFICCVCGTL